MASRTRDLLTAFSPSLDYLAICSGDGRIKIWDTVKCQLQMEFSDIASTQGNKRFLGSDEPERGHLSLDYTCMAWLTLNKEKKRKLASSLLVLGTGSGDLLAIDVSAGHLKWTYRDCHPGGVKAVSFSFLESCIYTAGADRMICKLESQSGNLKEKFKGSNKEISTISVSPDGKIMAISSALMKIFSCPDHLKIQKFSGHPAAVRSTSFSDDGKYMISCGFGERYVALWCIDGGKTRSSRCFLSMEHPAVSIDCKISQKKLGTCFCVLALSEVGDCYVWYGQSIEELQSSKPAKVLLSSEKSVEIHNKGSLQTIFSAKLMGHCTKTEVEVFVSYGLVVKPLFQKIVVKLGLDTILHMSQQGLLLPLNRIGKSNRSVDTYGVTALDSSNVDDALLPTTKVSDIDNISSATVGSMSHSSHADAEDYSLDWDNCSPNLEQELRQLGVLSSVDYDTLNNRLDVTDFSDINLESSKSTKKMRTAILSMDPISAMNLLEELILNWQTRNYKGKYVLPWIRNILIFHGHQIMEQEKLENHTLDSFSKISKSRQTAVQQLLQLSGRLQLVLGQIDKAAVNKDAIERHDTDSDEEEDSDADERLHEEDEGGESELSSDDDV